jgi:hypothetical protein
MIRFFYRLQLSPSEPNTLVCCFFLLWVGCARYPRSMILPIINLLLFSLEAHELWVNIATPGERNGMK